MQLLDWLVVAAYVAFALAVGVRFARRAGQDVDQFFLSGRTLPWWIAGTSMVATTFASDTPLVITGWIRDEGIWQNWLWWGLAGGSMLTVFLFARYWRRGEVMTTAELAELRYGGAEASVLRGFVGVYQALITNTIILCWVILAAAKIMDVLFAVDRRVAVAIACLMALTYATMAGFWGVVLTDLVQFTMAMVGALVLAFVSWHEIGGSEGLLAAAEAGGGFTEATLSFFPRAGDGGLFSASFWTIPLATATFYLGVAWWANDLVDGGSLAVQRIAACRTERDGMLATLWYSVAHFALRPWPWIVVALASMVVLPRIDVEAPTDGVVARVEADAIWITPAGGAPDVEVDLAAAAAAEDWAPDKALRSVGDPVQKGETIARTDSERAYVVMMSRYLPVGLLGLAVASLLAAFMSTVDTHLNLASSFFVNDVYRRFIRRDAGPKHYVRVARIAGAGVLAVAGVLAAMADSISDLFTFFMAFLSGVGPVYVLRWLWWRVRATTEIVAIVVSSVSATYLTFADIEWNIHPFSNGGDLEHSGRVCMVVVVTALCAFGSLLVTARPDPRALVAFYRRVRPMGWWAPVRELCPDVEPRHEGAAVLVGCLGGLAMIYGLLLGIGQYLLDRTTGATIGLVSAVVGVACVRWALARLRT